MGYQEVFGDLEDFAMELNASKAKKLWFRIAQESAEIVAEVPTTLPDGTGSKEKMRGMRRVATITLTALGFFSSAEEPKTMGSSMQLQPKPDMQMVFTAPIVTKDCFTPQDMDAFEKEMDNNWKAVINEVNKVWKGAVFEGVGSVIPQ
jgi:hypothetical protein